MGKQRSKQLIRQKGRHIGNPIDEQKGRKKGIQINDRNIDR